MAHRIEHTELGLPAMDRVHAEFIELYQDLCASSGAQFAALFEQLRLHTEEHFAAEEALMANSAYPASAEHRSDHQRVLGEFARFGSRVQAGQTRFARAWLVEQIPDWFRSHLHNMDSSLAAHLKDRAPTS